MAGYGVLAGLVGGVTIAVWQALSGWIFELYEIVPEVLFSTITIVVVGLIGLQPADEVRGRFEHYRNPA